MPINPADGPILGTLYGSDAMRAVFAEQAYFQRMLDVEAALARVQGRMGLNPQHAADAIVQAARSGKRGAGKIFVTSVERVVRIRTGEEDETAV